VKAIGLFLKNSTLHSRISSCSSKSSKSTGGGILDGQTQSPPLKFYPNTKQTLMNYHSHGNLTSTDRTKQTFVKTNGSTHRVPSHKVQSRTPTATGQKLMPT
jgi:hypothetical protein